MLFKVNMEMFMHEVRRLACSTTEPIPIVLICEVEENGKTQFKEYSIGNEKYIQDNDWHFLLVEGRTKESLGVHDILDIVEDEALSDDCWDNDVYTSRFDSCINGDIYFCFDMEKLNPCFVIFEMDEGNGK